MEQRRVVLPIRVFREQVGEPPARDVERIRIEAARALLDSSPLGLGCAPDTYRRRFRAS